MAKKEYKESVNAKEPQQDLNITLNDYVLQFNHGYRVFDHIGIMNGKPSQLFWTHLFEPSNNECKRLTNESRVSWPYADRLIYLINKFKKEPERNQNYILKAREINIFWRGDDIDMFRRIVRETLKFRKLDASEKEEYKIKDLRAAIGNNRRNT